MDKKTKNILGITLVFLLLASLALAFTYLSIVVSPWFYILTVPAAFFLFLFAYVVTGADDHVQKFYRARVERRRAAKELRRQHDLETFVKRKYLSDGEHHHFLKFIHSTLIRKGLTSEWGTLWGKKSEIIELLHLNPLNLNWVEELDSMQYQCENGDFHGSCVQFFTWGRAVLNFSMGKLDGHQQVYCEEDLVLELSFKDGDLVVVDDIASSKMRIRTTVVKDVFEYSIELGPLSIRFKTCCDKPEFSRRRLSKEIESLEYWRYATPNGTVQVTDLRNSASMEIELENDSARILHTRGPISSLMREKQFWSQLAFLNYDYRFVIGRYYERELLYDTGVKGPPGIGRGTWEYPSPIQSYEQFFV